MVDIPTLSIRKRRFCEATAEKLPCGAFAILAKMAPLIFENVLVFIGIYWHLVERVGFF